MQVCVSYWLVSIEWLFRGSCELSDRGTYELTDLDTLSDSNERSIGLCSGYRPLITTLYTLMSQRPPVTVSAQTICCNSTLATRPSTEILSVLPWNLASKGASSEWADGNAAICSFVALAAIALGQLVSFGVVPGENIVGLRA